MKILTISLLWSVVFVTVVLCQEDDEEQIQKWEDYKVSVGRHAKNG